MGSLCPILAAPAPRALLPALMHCFTHISLILFLPPAPHAFACCARAPWVACCHHPLHLSQLAGQRRCQHRRRLAALCDLTAGKAAAQWYVVSRHHLLELLGGRKRSAGTFSQLCSEVGKDSLEAGRLGQGRPPLSPQLSSRGLTLRQVHTCLLN